MQTAVERLRHELNDRFRDLRHELDQIEMLANAIEAFSEPVPDYEAGFRHFAPSRRDLDRFALSAKRARRGGRKRA
jgi:hypothetical protein